MCRYVVLLSLCWIPAPPELGWPLFFWQRLLCTKTRDISSPGDILQYSDLEKFDFLFAGYPVRQLLMFATTLLETIIDYDPGSHKNNISCRHFWWLNLTVLWCYISSLYVRCFNTRKPYFFIYPPLLFSPREINRPYSVTPLLLQRKQ